MSVEVLAELRVGLAVSGGAKRAEGRLSEVAVGEIVAWSHCGVEPDELRVGFPFGEMER
jgi:hypothetical protein